MKAFKHTLSYTSEYKEDNYPYEKNLASSVVFTTDGQIYTSDEYTGTVYRILGGCYYPSARIYE